MLLDLRAEVIRWAGEREKRKSQGSELEPRILFRQIPTHSPAGSVCSLLLQQNQMCAINEKQGWWWGRNRGETIRNMFKSINIQVLIIGCLKE